MSPRQARRERREAERKAKKLDLKKMRLADANPLASPEIHPEIQPRWHPELADEFPREVQIRNTAVTDRRSLQAETNRANAKLSTGPRTTPGKLASSRNSFKHGLASGQLIIAGEDRVAFEAFLNDLLEEHQPANASQQLLIKEMAQSHWLAQRAIRLQTACFTAEGVNEKQLALFLRYQTTHQRAFYKALDTLLKLRKIGFVSQHASKARANAGFVSHRSLKQDPADRFVSQNAPDAASNQQIERQTQAA